MRLSGTILAEEICRRVQHGLLTRPRQAVFLVSGNDHLAYRRAVERGCQAVGISYRTQAWAADLAGGLAQIAALNRDPLIQGIGLELPLPAGWDRLVICSALDPAKDIDCLHPDNLGRLLLRQPRVVPAAARAAFLLLQSVCPVLKGQRVCLVGSSLLIGQPLAQLLSQAKCTVTLTNSDTPRGELISLLQSSPIVISAIGVPHFLQPEWFATEAIIIDIGTSLDATGQVVGDVNPHGLVCQALTPVPGGVGPVTIACLLENILQL